jgi:hypothetical protein
VGERRVVALDATREGRRTGPVDPREVLWSLGPHDVALALRLLGPELQVTKARPLLDGLRMELEAGNGRRAEVTLRRVEDVKHRRSRLRLEDGGSFDVDELEHPAEGELALGNQLTAFLGDVGAPWGVARGTIEQGARVVELLAAVDAALARERAHRVRGAMNAGPPGRIEDGLPVAIGDPSG